MSVPQGRKRLYFPHLDGLRGLFFILVFLAHGCRYDAPQVKEHWLNPVVQLGTVHSSPIVMVFFFVMSSFIITTLLLHETHQHGRIQLRNFYLRRVLRIWPLYYVVLFIGFGFYPWLRSFGSHPYSAPADLKHYVTFIQNFDMHESPQNFLGLNVLWSIAVEEQFYLVWPLILLAVPVRRYLLALLILFCTALGWQIAHPQEGFHTITCTVDLAIGGAAAVAVFYAQQHRHPLARRWLLAVYRMPRFWIAALWLAALYLYRYGLTEAPAAVQPLERLLVAVVATAVLLEQNYARQSLLKFGNWRAFRFLGQLALGLYLLHGIAIVFFKELYHVLGLNENFWDLVLIEPLLAFGLSLLLATASFRYLELPFLRLYPKLRVKSGKAAVAQELTAPVRQSEEVAA